MEPVARRALEATGIARVVLRVARAAGDASVEGGFAGATMTRGVVGVGKGAGLGIDRSIARATGGKCAAA
jgi:hypothetical protein